jgi:hypothetical protein
MPCVRYVNLKLNASWRRIVYVGLWIWVTECDALCPICQPETKRILTKDCICRPIDFCYRVWCFAVAISAWYKTSHKEGLYLCSCLSQNVMLYNWYINLLVKFVPFHNDHLSSTKHFFCLKFITFLEIGWSMRDFAAFLERLEGIAATDISTGT